MNRKLKQVLTALVGGLIAGVTLVICLVIFVALATPEAIAINPILFLLLGLAPSILVVGAFTLLLVYFGFGTVLRSLKLFKNYVVQEENGSTLSFYFQIFAILALPFALVLNTGVIASSAQGGTWAVIATLIIIVVNAILIDRVRKFAKSGTLTWVKNALRAWLRRNQPLGRRPHSA